MTDDELRSALREHALLEGDFVLRSGRRSNHYFDKYRFETRPELLEAIGERVAAVVGEHEPEAARLAGPELGAVALAAASSLASRIPFLIVRKDTKDYGTANRIEGAFEPGQALREAGLECRTAVCVVDRDEGGRDELARFGVRLRPLFRAGELLPVEKTAANRLVERKQDRC